MDLLASCSEEGSASQGSRLLERDASVQGDLPKREWGVADEESEEVCGWG